MRRPNGRGSASLRYVPFIDNDDSDRPPPKSHPTSDTYTHHQLLCTHKHWDHAGGNEQLAAAIPNLQVVTTKHEDIPAATVKLDDADTYDLGSLEVTALYAPCHTRGHVLFYVTPKDQAERERTAPLLFSGDTLFVGGCGRFFEGDGAQSKFLSVSQCLGLRRWDGEVEQPPRS